MLSRIWHVLDAAWEDSDTLARIAFVFIVLFGLRIVESLSGLSIDVAWQSREPRLVAEFIIRFAVSFPVGIAVLLTLNAARRRIQR